MVRSAKAIERCKGTFLVYALCDPGTENVRYVGVCKDTAIRIKGHLSECGNSETRAALWFRELKAKSLTPEVIILDSANGLLNGYSVEKKWIRAYSLVLGDQLLNKHTRADFLHFRDFEAMARRFAARLRQIANHEKQAAIRANRPTRIRRLVYRGRELTLTQWARELGITKQALYLRLKTHPVEVALSRGKSPNERLVPKPALQEAR